MPVYAAKFNGYNPVGACAVVVAPTRKVAAAMLSAKLRDEMKLPQEINPEHLILINPFTTQVHIILDGEY